MGDLASIEEENGTRIMPEESSMNTTVRWDSAAPTLHVFESPSEKTEDTWYLKEDLDNVKEQCEGLRVLGNRGFVAGAYSCYWGLEHTICEELSQNRSIRKQEAVDVVIDEQENQREDGEYMPDYIAEIYRDISITSHWEAHEQALRYRQELKEEAEESIELSGQPKIYGPPQA
jgi:hypothetical protein